MTTSDVAYGLVLAASVIAALGGWFYACGRADRKRRVRPFARRTLVYAGVGFVVGLAFLTSDASSAQPQERMGIVALTVGCFLLLYAAVSAMVASDDDALVVVNLTGRALLLTDPELAPFYTLPAPQQDPATTLPPECARTCYIVSAELGRAGAEAGRTDLFTIDAGSASDPGANGPLLVRRLVRAVPADLSAERPASSANR